MKTELQLNWIGPWIPQRNLVEWMAASPAAMKWQKHLVDALVMQGVAVNWIYYRPEPYWPRGRLLPWHTDSGGLVAPTCNNSELQYINLPVIRANSLQRSCEKRIKKMSGRKQILVSYNAPNWFRDCLLQLRSQIDVCWICIVADDYAPQGADGYVFLSHGYFERFSQTKKKLHLDGGVYPPRKQLNDSNLAPRLKKMRFMYSGSLGKWGGISTVLNALQYIDTDEFEVLISGFGITTENLKRVNEDGRVLFLGTLDVTKLTMAYASTDVFLNPRPTRIRGGENNFPSKLFDYLGWGKPIISTWTEGLAPEYRHVLNVVEDNAQSMAAEMVRLIQNVPSQQRPIEWAFRFNKTWDQQADRLSGFIKQVCHIA